MALRPACTEFAVIRRKGPYAGLRPRRQYDILVLESGEIGMTHKNAQKAEQNRDTAHLTGDKAVAGRGVSPSHDPVSLAQRLRAGERTAAEELVDKYYQRIYLFMRAVGHDRQISEDLTQETFFRAWNHIGQLRDNKALNGWLFRIAGNVSRLHWRRHKHTDETSLESVAMQDGGVDSAQWVREQEEFARVREVVAQLPWKLKQAIVLHYLEQLTIAEAADAAGVRDGTFKSRLNRALEALRRELGSV